MAGCRIVSRVVAAIAHGNPGHRREARNPVTRSFEAALLSRKTTTRVQDVLLSPDGDLQLPRNILKRGDRMGTSTFQIA